MYETVKLVSMIFLIQGSCCKTRLQQTGSRDKRRKKGMCFLVLHLVILGDGRGWLLTMVHIISYPRAKVVIPHKFFEDLAHYYLNVIPELNVWSLYLVLKNFVTLLNWTVHDFLLWSLFNFLIAYWFKLVMYLFACIYDLD